jgi:hypothetical protein
MLRVLVRGDGIAARCCEHLLHQAGCEVVSDRLDRPRLPAIMLGGAAVAMMRDVFGQQQLFRGMHQIRKRVVAWGQGREPVSLEHSAVVVSERELLESVGEHESNRVGGVDWTVITSRPLPEESIEHRFGSRMTRAQAVALAGVSDTCWIESLDNGWLFLIPSSERTGWLLSIGSADLRQSRLIAPQVADVRGGTSQFPSHPRILQPLCGERWIACGSAAMAFDPLCGDGTANAVREAILASAVIRVGSDALRHYEARLTAGFQRHLSLCLSFYRSGGTGEWWESESTSLKDGLNWCAARAQTFGRYRYQLNGFDLAPVLP